MKNLKKAFCVILLLAVATGLLVARSPAQADMGPKPSVTVTFKNMGDELCYCTLLSERDNSGPHCVWDGNDENIYSDLDKDVFMAFVNYQDPDGFHFLQVGAQCNETKSFVWGYYAPSTFKILLYFPSTNTFVCSQICSRYAFDSYFAVNMKNVDITSTQTTPQLFANNSYFYFKEIVTFLVRMALTVAVEMGVAWIFRLRGKNVYLCLLITNVVTQLILNVVLNVAYYRSGMLMLVFVYVLLEFFVFLAEAITYGLVLAKVGNPPVRVWKSVLYAFVANLVSFALGMTLAIFLPALF